MDTKTILSEASDRMQKTIEHLEEELLNIRAGKASPTVLNGVFVDYYGSQTPISGVASVTVPDAKTILIQPWDKNLIRAIEKAIIDSNIGLTPSNNGEQIRLTIPPLTEERRKELVKQVRQEAETARISLRNARRDAVEAFKKAQKEGMPEDESKDGETQSQKLLDKFTKSLDAILDNKERDHDRIDTLSPRNRTPRRINAGVYLSSEGGFLYQVPHPLKKTRPSYLCDSKKSPRTKNASSTCSCWPTNRNP